MRKVQVVAQSARSCCIPRSMRCVLLSLLVVGLSSCFVARDSVNAPIEVRRYEQFVPGTTTAAEVVAAMGAPDHVGVHADHGVAAARCAAFHGFEKESVGAAFRAQFQIGGDGRFKIGDQTGGYEARASGFIGAREIFIGYRCHEPVRA